jgi:hypothetical protein
VIVATDIEIVKPHFLCEQASRVPNVSAWTGAVRNFTLKIFNPLGIILLGSVLCLLFTCGKIIESVVVVGSHAFEGKRTNCGVGSSAVKGSGNGSVVVGIHAIEGKWDEPVVAGSHANKEEQCLKRKCDPTDFFA